MTRTDYQSGQRNERGKKLEERHSSMHNGIRLGPLSEEERRKREGDVFISTGAKQGPLGLLVSYQ